MNKMAHNEIIELIPAYALGCLDAAEAAEVSVHLDTCATCRKELAAYEMVTDSLATAVSITAPPADLKARLLVRTQSSAKTAVAPEPGWPEKLARRLQEFLHGPRWRPVLALVVLVMIVGAIILIWQQNQRAPAAQFTLTPTDAAPGAEGLIAVAANGEATLTITNLSPLTTEQQYQLWLIHDGQRDSGAVFSVDDEGWAEVTIDAQRPLTSYGAFGITIEPAGGSPGPTGQRVLGFNL